MPKAYWIARVDVRDAEKYKDYVAANAEPFARFGARFLARGGRTEVMEGSTRARNVIIEFPSLDAAMSCFNDKAYQRARDIRLPVSDADLIIVEGVDGS